MNKKNIFVFLGLFGSVGTLLCCALPALFVSLGAGAVLASMIGSAPWLVVFSKYKLITFVIAGILLLLAIVMQRQSRLKECPIDSEQAAVCAESKKINQWVLYFSVAIYIIGFFFAYLASYLFN